MKKYIFPLLASFLLIGFSYASDYPKSFEDSFMQSCTGGDKKLESYCKCVLTELENKYSYKDIVNKYLNNRDEFDRIISSIAPACKR
jgi:hypothetical protein